MKNLNSTKSRVILSLAFLIVLFGGLIPTLGIFSSGKHPAHASTGWQLQELWHNSISIPTGSYSYPGVSDIIYSSGKVYETFGFHDLYYGGDTSITDGFDSSTGSQVWQKRAGIANSTPLIANGKIYFANQSQQLHVYDATDDQLPELWNGNSTTATLDNGILYSHSGNAWVQQPAGYYSYDASTGQTNWQQTDTTCDLYPKIEIYNSIVYYIGCEINPNLYSPIYYTIEARNASDGNFLWSTRPQYENTDSTGYPISPAPSYNSTLISNGYIFIAATNKVISYNATDGTQTWEKTLSDTPLPTGTRASIGQIIASGSTVYVLVNIAQTGNSSVISAEDVYALDAATGNEIWHNSTNTNASLTNASDLPYGTLVNGVLYFNYDSAIYAWDAATGNQLMMDDSVATSPTNPSISTPLIVGNTMYITREDVNTQLYTIYAYSILAQQPSPTPSPTPRGKLFIFLQGINSTLTPIQATNLTIPLQNSFGQKGGVYPFLRKNYPNASFRMFSYNGADNIGNPTSYKCQDTFTQHLSAYVSRLKNQIINYLINNPYIDVYLIGHSMGGAVALGLLADMKINGFLNVNGGKVAGVVSLDSPLGGTDPLFGANSWFTKTNFQGMCKALVPKHKPPLPMYSLDDLFSTFGGGTPYGGMDSIMLVINGGDFSNQEVASAAENANTPVLTIGNALDFIYTNDCPLTVSNFPSTQWVADQGDNSGVYGRVFIDNQALLTCTDATSQIAANHFHVFTNKQVENGLQQFINGQTPSALAIAPNGP